MRHSPDPKTCGAQNFRQYRWTDGHHQHTGARRHQDESPTPARVLERELLRTRATPGQSEHVDHADFQLGQHPAHQPGKLGKTVVGSPGVPSASNGPSAPDIPSTNNGGPSTSGVANVTDDDSDNSNLHPKNYRYADAVGSELTPGLPQTEPSVVGTTVPEGNSGNAAGMPGAGGGGGMPAPAMPIVMPVGQMAAPQGGQSRGPAVPASPIISATPQ
jgi:hypothetical protein